MVAVRKVANRRVGNCKDGRLSQTWRHNRPLEHVFEFMVSQNVRAHERRYAHQGTSDEIQRIRLTAITLYKNVYGFRFMATSHAT
jgi:hypothetical protein